MPQSTDVLPTNLSTGQQCERLTLLFQTLFANPPTTIERLKGDASARTIYRIVDATHSVIGIYGPVLAENRAFLSFTRTFTQLDLPVPEILIEDETGFCYLLEDLGNETLFDKLTRLRAERAGNFPIDQIRDNYRNAVETLVQFQIKSPSRIDRSLCYQGAEFDEAAWQRDHDYFLEKFIQILMPDSKNRFKLELEFATHRSLLAEFPRDAFLYRDFQSRNIMVTARGLVCIDYQSGRIGAPCYDIASLLFDARADLPPDFREELREIHFSLLEQHGYPPAVLDASFAPYALLRVLQALGSYGNNGILKGHRQHLSAIPFGLRNALSIINSDTRLRKMTPLLSETIARIAELKPWTKFLESDTIDRTTAGAR